MNRSVRSALFATLFLAMPSLADPRLLESKRLFSVRSSYNQNEVVYDALLEGGQFDPGRPIRAYWILHSKHDELENLGALEERLAFGIVLEKVSADEVIFHVKGSAARKITVRIEASGVSAYTTIHGEEGSIASVYAAVDSRGLIPSVKYVELLGHARSGGAMISERINP